MVKKSVPNKRCVLPETQRKEMILNAALDIFSHFGYESSDVDRIAEKAGVGKGTIYRYFSSKEELFLALMDHGFKLLNEYMYTLQLPEISFRERLIRGMQMHVDFFVENPKFYQVLILLMPDHRLKIGADFTDRHRRYIQPLIKTVKRAIRNGEMRRIDPEFAAASLIAMSCIVVERYRCKRNMNIRKKDIKTAVELFLQGVGK